MKIGILTFHTPINYGAALQAYALQKYLKTEYPAHITNTIDFKTDLHISKYKIFVPVRKNIIAYIFQQFCALLRYKDLKFKEKKFKSFISEEFTLTQRYKTETELLSQPPQMDAYIVGSDQVFHPNSPYLKVYYLSFSKGNSKKIAYSPSFGNSLFTEDFKLKIKPYLNDFDYLSCRESDGAKFISDIVGNEVPVVVDPVFLLSSEQWSDISVDPKFRDKYIFIYDLNGGYDLIRIAKQIQKQTGLKIVCLTQHPSRFYNVSKQIYNSGPKEFVGLIRNAEYIVTDSFHGTAFSVLFGKPQFVYNAKPNAFSRIKSLLSKLNLENRIVDHGQSSKFTFELNYSSLDYFEKLDEMIKESKAYLKKAIAQ